MRVSPIPCAAADRDPVSRRLRNDGHPGRAGLGGGGRHRSGDHATSAGTRATAALHPDSRELRVAEDFQAETESLAAEYREHVNFENQWGLGHVKADYAYGHLSQIMGEDVAPGAGVTIGFIDSGIDQGHPDFDGKTITEHLYGARDETGHRFSHGTAVASVAAAIRSPHEYSAHGVAWGTDIAMFAIPTVPAGDRPYTPISLERLAEQGRFGSACSTTCWCPGPWCRTSTS